MLSAFARAVRQPVVAVLALAGVVDVVTGDPAAHGLALVAVAGMLLADGYRQRTTEVAEPALERWRFEITPGVIAAGVLYAAVAAMFARSSWPLTLAILGPAVWAVSFAWRGTPVVADELEPLDGMGVGAWVGVFLAAAVWEVQALLQQPTLTTSSWTHPTLSTLMDPVLSTYPGRAISLAIWLLIGGYLLER